MRIDLKPAWCSVNRNRAFFEPWRLWVTRTNCFCYFIFFNCVQGGLMHKLVWPSELFCSLSGTFGCAATLTPGIPVPSSTLLLAVLPGHWNGLETNKCCSLLEWKWGEGKGRTHLWDLPSFGSETLWLVDTMLKLHVYTCKKFGDLETLFTLERFWTEFIVSTYIKSG